MDEPATWRTQNPVVADAPKRDVLNVGTDVENEIGKMVAKLRADTPKDALPSRIGEHAKSIMQHCTGSSLERIAALREALDALERGLRRHEDDLNVAIERQVQMSQSADNAAKVIGDTIADWVRQLNGGKL